MPKISIIIPVYNSENHLRECLDSVVNQSLNDIEIIVVNDCSTDNSQCIINEYVARYYPMVHAIKSIIHIGQGEARNLGIKNATGTYIGFVDSDDFIDKNMYLNLYTEALKNGYPEICSGNIVRVSEYGEKYCFDDCFLSSTRRIYTLSDNFNCFYLLPSCCDKIFKRDRIITKFLDVKLWEDRGFLYSNLINSKSFVVVPNATYYYRIHHDYGVSSISRNINVNLLAIITIANQIEDSILSNKDFDLISRKALLLNLIMCIKCIKDILLWDIKRKDQLEIIRLYDMLVCQKFADWRSVKEPIFIHRIQPENLLNIGLPRKLKSNGNIQELESNLNFKILELSKKSNH